MVENSKEAEIKQTNKEILSTIDDIGTKIKTTVKKKEDLYLQNQHEFANRKQKELQDIVNHLELM